MLINILISYFPEKKEEFYGRRVFLCGSTRFPASIGFQLEYFAFWTSDSCLRISDFIHLHGTFLKHPKMHDQFFFVITPYELAKLLRTINESKTIPPHPKIVASLHHQNRPRIACITAHARKTLLPQKSTIASSTNVQRKRI